MTQECCLPVRTDCVASVRAQTVCLVLKPARNSKIKATRTTTILADCSETVSYAAIVSSYNPLTGYTKDDEVPCGTGEFIPFDPVGGGSSGGGGTGLTDAQLRATPVPISGTVAITGGGGGSSVAALGTQLLTNAAVATTGIGVTNIPKGIRTFQASGTVSSGTGAAQINIEGSLDGVAWDVIGTINLTLGTTVVANTSSGSVTDQSSFLQYRGRVLFISGSGPLVNLKVGV